MNGRTLFAALGVLYCFARERELAQLDRAASERAQAGKEQLNQIVASERAQAGKEQLDQIVASERAQAGKEQLDRIVGEGEATTRSSWSAALEELTAVTPPC